MPPAPEPLRLPAVAEAMERYGIHPPQVALPAFFHMVFVLAHGFPHEICGVTIVNTNARQRAANPELLAELLRQHDVRINSLLVDLEGAILGTILKVVRHRLSSGFSRTLILDEEDLPEVWKSLPQVIFAAGSFETAAKYFRDHLPVG